jgi:RNA polymerase sigma factor (sigma-70 family)
MNHRDNETWVAELKGQRGQQPQEEAFQDLGKALQTCVRWHLSSRAALPPTLASSSYHDLDQLAQDIAQESLERIWQKGLDSYRGDARFLTFAQSVAINQARQRLRQLWRRRDEPWPSPEEDEMEQGSDEFPVTARSEIVMRELAPEKQIMLREVLKCLDRILMKQCTPREREAFEKRYLDGLSAKEVAKQMDTTGDAVNMLTFSARQKLRTGLEEIGYTLEMILAVLDE